MHKQHWKQPDQPYYVEVTEDANTGQKLYQARLRDGSFDTFLYEERNQAVSDILNYIEKGSN